jgi:hypothetical protein
LGKTCHTNLNKKENKKKLRNVTFAPIGIPLRIFNAAIDFFERIKKARCPVINSKKCINFYKYF